MLKQYTVPDKKRVGSTCRTTRFRYVISCNRDFFRSCGPALGIVVVRFGSCNTRTHIYTHVDLEAIQSQKKCGQPQDLDMWFLALVITF
jgi:hypothetical protein